MIVKAEAGTSKWLDGLMIAISVVAIIQGNVDDMK